MAKKGHSEEQILRALHQAESGTRVADICREHGISEATFYIWKKKCSASSQRKRVECFPSAFNAGAYARSQRWLVRWILLLIDYLNSVMFLARLCLM